MEAYTPGDFESLFSLNVRAPFFLMQKLLSVLNESASTVVTTSLVARYAPGESGTAGAPSLPAYAAMKERWRRWSGTGPHNSASAASV